MLRLGDNIRMTASERRNLSQLVGFDANPQTVVEHDAMVSRGKAGYDRVVATVTPELDAEGADNSGSAEARLMAAVFVGMLIEV